jgi:hypothetical protein
MRVRFQSLLVGVLLLTVSSSGRAQWFYPCQDCTQGVFSWGGSAHNHWGPCDESSWDCSCCDNHCLTGESPVPGTCPGSCGAASDDMLFVMLSAALVLNDANRILKIIQEFPQRLSLTTRKKSISIVNRGGREIVSLAASPRLLREVSSKSNVALRSSTVTPVVASSWTEQLRSTFPRSQFR